MAGEPRSAAQHQGETGAPDLAELERLYHDKTDPTQRRQLLDLMRSFASGNSSPDLVPASLVRRLHPPKSGPRILLVDDDSDVLVSIGGWLEAGKIEVIRAGGGADALGLLGDGEAVDAVVTDIMMPGMSGVEFLALARRIRRTLPALIITGYADFAGGSELPADVAVLGKPFRRKEFMLKVQVLLNSSGSLPENYSWGNK